MTSRSFRRLFPQLNVQSVPEDEFYRQAVLSQLLTGPDEQELSSFRPEVRVPLELVEATPELAGMLGSSLEFVDSHWDSLEGSPPPTPPAPPSPGAPQRIPPLLVRQTSTDVQWRGPRTADPAPKVESGSDVSLWEPAQEEATRPCGVWEIQRPHSRTHPDSRQTTSTHLWGQEVQHSKDRGMRSNTWEPVRQQSKTDAAEGDSTVWEPQRQLTADSTVWEPTRHRTKTSAGAWEPQRLRDKNVNGAEDSYMWKRPTQGSGSAPHAAAHVWEPQRLRSKSAQPDARMNPDPRGNPETKREAGSCDGAGGKNMKLDAAWNRNLGDLRVHVQDVGVKGGGGGVQRDVKKDQGKGTRVKTRS